MGIFLLFVFILIVWAVLSSRIKALRKELEAARENESTLRKLIERVYMLEQAVARGAQLVATPEPVAQPQVIPEPEPELPVPEPVISISVTSIEATIEPVQIPTE